MLKRKKPLRTRSPKKEAELAAGKHKPRKAMKTRSLSELIDSGVVVKAKTIARPKPKSDETLPALDRTLVTLFNRYVRLSARNHEGYVVCFICGRSVPYEESEAMHFEARQGRGTRFHTIAVQPGCHSCNSKPNGDRKNFARRLDERFGPGTASRMTILSKQVMRYDRGWYHEQIKHYKHLISLT